MKRRSTSASVFAFAISLALALPLAAQTGPPTSDGGGTSLKVEVKYPVRFDVSPPLREMEPIPPSQDRYLPEEHELPPWINRAPEDAPRGLPGPHVHQTWTGKLAMPSPIMNFEGIGDGFSGFSVSGEPPDTNGDVGLNYYIQWVNTSFVIFNKSDGSIQYGPAAGNTIWQSFGGRCETDNSGDPIVQYDQLANRWVMTQFAVSSSPYYQCVAVSQTSDPTGSWYRYAYDYGTNMNDYPKMGVWPDGYYITYNMFANGSSWAGGEVCAFDRAKMIAGDPSATQQCFGPYSSYGGFQPADLDGSTLPPSGSPNYILAFGTNSLQLWKFHVDWTDPSNSTFTGPTTISVASFSEACSGGTCIPQNGTTYELDSLADRLMYRLAYRNFGTHESLVVNHSISGSSAASAVRWYELRDPNGTPTIYQSGTYEPDSTSRWMGSIAMDKMGNMALGYSASGSSTYPSIWYAGRLVTDALGTLPQAESVIVNGTGYHNGNSRWGDYSSMSVDPSDDCTFWYTQEYYTTSGSFAWHTRIASFKYPSCTTCTDNPDSVDVTPDGPLTLCTGTGQTLTANVTGGTGPFTYQWYRDGTAISGATSSSYTANDTGTHTYNCEVTGASCTEGIQDSSDTQITWTNTPVFNGLDSVTNPENATCQLDLAWTAASNPCGGVTYNVYRSTTSGFTPSSSNRIATGVTDTSYSDTDGLVSGTTYYYIVRAVDASSGSEEGNTVERSGTPTGASVVIFSDDFEGGNLGWTFTKGTPAAATGDFLIGDPVGTTGNYGQACQPEDDHTAAPGVNCMYTAENPDGGAGTDDIDDGEVITTSPVFDASGYDRVVLNLWRWYENEDVDDSGDYYILEVSNDGGATWTTLENLDDNVTDANVWTNVQFNLESFVTLTANMQIRVRGADGTAAGDLVEIAIDDVTITGYASCTTGGACTDPGQPSIDSITDNDACAQDGVTITYTAGSGASSHDLYVDGSLAVSNFSSGSTYDPGDTASHSYVIRALDSTCYTDSAAQSATDEDNTPATPGAPSVTDPDACALTGVQISWSSVTGATAYDLLVDSATTVSNVSSPYTYSPGDSNSHTYQVRARNATCTGSWSGATSGTDSTATPPATPSAPSVTDKSACGLTGLTISWTSVSGATTYDLMEDSTVIATGITATSYDRNPGDSASHTYQVRANNSCGQSSGWSSGASGADADHSFTFDGIQTATDRDSCDDTGVVLTWNAPASWNDGGSGTRSFEIWRDGVAIATGVSEASTSYTDTSGTNGTSYSYAVRGVNGFSCATDGGASLSASDNVGTPPSFSGLSSVTTMSGDRCGLRLEWPAATPGCGTSIVYNVYRSTTSGFTPDGTTLLASCVPDLFYEDTTITSGTTYYYVVHAEDNSVGHGGVCNSGFEETNTVERSGSVSSGTTTQTVFYDDFEGSPTPSGHEWIVGYFSDDGGDGADWHIASNMTHNGSNSGQFGDGTQYVNDSDDGIIAGCDGSTGNCGTSGMNGIVIPADASSVTLTFWEWRDFESGYDGSMLMYSTTDAFSGYTQVPDTDTGSGPYISSVLYDDTLSNSCPPSSGPANSEIWTNNIGSWQQVTVNLDRLAGQTIWLLWRATTDCSIQHEGWYIDEVKIEAVIPGSNCTSPPESVQSFTARSVSGQVKLEWVNPSAGAYGSTKICRDTADYPDPSSCTPIVTQTGTPGQYDSATDSSGLTNGTTYYYTAFVDDGTGVYSSGQTVSARPFDTAASQVKWAYSSAASALAPTGVRPGPIGTGGTWAVSNDRMLHGMNPTASGGDWPRSGSFTWKPAGMNGPAQSRPPVVPTTAVTGSSAQVIFLGSEDGHVYAVNAENGATLWQSPALGSMLLASPSGLFTDFGGSWSLLFVGSRDATADNVMYMLNPADGSIITQFDNGGGTNGMGVISSGATVDYVNNRIYFASRERSGGSSDTLWCLSFTGTSFTKLWSKPYGDIDGAPVELGGRLYVGNNSGIVYAIDPSNGNEIWHYATNDGAVKGFVTPEYTTSTPRKLYFSTTNTVWALTDNGGSASQAWQQGGVAGPSIPLAPFGDSVLYVGSTNGSLYQLDADTGTVQTSVVLGDGTAAIGSPAMDIINNMAYVGSESGAVYGVQLPLQ